LIPYALLLIGSFLLGSIPFGYLIARSRGIDIRKVGSGNIGATNVNRALGSRLGILVFALDVLKALIPVLAARNLVPHGIAGIPEQVAWFLAGLAALLGHMFSPWLGFRGGKGIASGLGAIVGSTPIVGALGFVLFLCVTIPTRYISLGSIVAVLSLPVLVYAVPGQDHWLALIYGLIAIFIVYKHRENIHRIRNGTESRFSFRAKGSESDRASEGDMLQAESNLAPADENGHS
jgi:glycerol-3-phosphate acyltransferase PlsY